MEIERAAMYKLGLSPVKVLPIQLPRIFTFCPTVGYLEVGAQYVERFRLTDHGWSFLASRPAHYIVLKDEIFNFDIRP